MELNDYTPKEQDELKAISACMASIEKLEILSARINKTDRPYIVKDIAALKANLEGTEIRMADCVELRKINFFV